MPGRPLLLKQTYTNHLAGVTNKDLVLFDCDGVVKTVNGRALARYITEQDPDQDALKFTRRTMFYGQSLFTAALLAVTNPKPLKAYYLTGHGEPRLDGTDDLGYVTFNAVLRQIISRPRRWHWSARTRSRAIAISSSAPAPLLRSRPRSGKRSMTTCIKAAGCWHWSITLPSSNPPASN